MITSISALLSPAPGDPTLAGPDAGWPVTDLVGLTDLELAAHAVDAALARSVDDVAERLRLFALVEVQQELLARRGVPSGRTLPMSAQGCYAQWVAYRSRRGSGA